MQAEKRSKSRINAEKRIQEVILIAENIIAMKGMRNLALQEIIDKSTMSRGTFFKQFPNKETVLTYLAIAGLNYWNELIARTSNYTGLSREKMIILHVTQVLCSRLRPYQYDAIFEANNVMNRSAVSEEINNIFDDRIRIIIQVIQGYIKQAINVENTLTPLHSHLDTEDLAFFVWSSRYGASCSSLNFQISKKEGDLNQKYKIFTQVILDSLGWKPLSNEINYDRVLSNLLTTYFNKERKEAKKTINKQGAFPLTIIDQENL